MKAVMEQIQRLSQSNPNLELQTEIFPLFFARVPLLVIKFKNGTMMDIQIPLRGKTFL